MKPIKRLLAGVLSGVMLLAVTACAKEPAPSVSTQAGENASATQTKWPEQDIKILTTVKAGGNMDIKARLVAKYLGQELGVNVMVENAPGGGGVTGMTQYLAEKPNTHTLIYMGVPHLTTAPFFSDVQYTAEDIHILSGLDTVKNGLFVSASSGITSLEQLLSRGRDGGIIKFGSAGVNNDTFLFTKVLFEKAGVSSDSVDSDSSAESLVNCIAGTVDVAYSAMNLAQSYVESGELVSIGVFSEQDYTDYQGMTVPSFKSLGYEIVYEATSFFAIRSGTDQAILDKVAQALHSVCDDPSFKKEFEEAGFHMMQDRSANTINAEIEALTTALDQYRELF